MKDLIFIVPCKNTQFVLKGGLSRHKSLGIQPINYDIFVHSNRDPGVRTTGAAIANSQRERYEHALLIFDHEGCGAEDACSAEDLQNNIESELRPTWGNNARVIVISPEVDIWLWGSSNVLSEVLSWPSEEGDIRAWLKERGFQFSSDGKPIRPKEAFEKLREVHGKPRSSSLYQMIASKISMKHCTDAAFLEIAKILREWFPSSISQF